MTNPFRSLQSRISLFFRWLRAGPNYQGWLTIKKLEMKVLKLESEAKKMRSEMAHLAGVMHDPAKPISVERMVWRRFGGESHGHLPETWRDYAMELEKRLAGLGCDEFNRGGF